LFFDESSDDVLKALSTSKSGLSDEEAKARMAKYGPNALKEKNKKSALMLYLEQFKSHLIVILMIAAIISFFLRDYVEGIAISVALLINATMGFVQEYKAEKSIEALRKLASLRAKVLRDGEKKEIEVSDLVPGDIVFVEVGEKIPADCRIIDACNLEAGESSLTGESVPISKNSQQVKSDSQIADQSCMLFSSTIITKGRGLAVVVKTGHQTEIGKIADMIQVPSEQTPLQKKLSQLSGQLTYIIFAIVMMIFIVGLTRHLPFYEIFLISVALAVAAIPEGLPIVVTVTAAIGLQRMIKRNALIRKLPAVETLGCVTVICTDKTGTLTCNEMTVRKLYVDGTVIDVTGEGYSSEGDFLIDGKPVTKKDIIEIESAELLFRVGALCNDSAMKEDKKFGDPTEIALIVSAAKSGLNKFELEKIHPRLDEIPFDSERKMMTTVHEVDHIKYAYVKGAPDIVLKSCNRIFIDGRVERLTEAERKKILKANDDFSSQALRVLAFAYKPVKGKVDETDLIFVGLQAMMDPPRKEIADAVKKCEQAGIKVVMITGDHKATASAIGKSLGLETRVLTGEEIDKIGDLKNVVEDIIIFARVAPEHKLRIVEALKAHGHVVAMTGDGVNDAPALKRADIGIAMGITGTDVAKESSSMILTDDNFASIVSAVEEGRGIYDNIKKFLAFQLSTNIGAIITIVSALMLSLPIPFTALQLLYINIMVDGPPAISLGMEPIEKGIMNRPPRNPKESVITKWNLVRMFILAIVMGLGTLGIFYFYLNSFGEVYAKTIAFTTLILFVLFNAFNSRSEEKSLFSMNFFQNKMLVSSVALLMLLQLVLVYFAPAALVFGLVPLAGIDWLWMVLVASVVIWADELMKWFKRRKYQKNT